MSLDFSSRPLDGKKRKAKKALPKRTRPVRRSEVASNEHGFRDIHHNRRIARGESVRLKTKQKRSKNRKPFKLWSFKKIVIYLILLGLIIGAGAFAYMAFTLPKVDRLDNLFASQSSVITDRNGVELYRFFEDEDRTLVKLDQIPQHMIDAMVAIEDKRYFSRSCLDLRALARVVVFLGSRGGGSTLTRQLARNALLERGENRYVRKGKEILLACSLESEYTKDEIMEFYLNRVPFGQNAYGVEQASRVYFGKSASGMTLAQAAILASLPQRPSALNPYGNRRYSSVTESAMEQINNGSITKQSQIAEEDFTYGLIGQEIGTGSNIVYIGGRADQVLKNMMDQGYITETMYRESLVELREMEFTPSRDSIRAPHFVLWIRTQLEELFANAEEGLLEKGGLIIETTLDWELQQLAEEAVNDQLETTKDKWGANNMALLSLDVNTSEVMAYVGNADFVSGGTGSKIDMVQVPRQPGSSFKPLVYATAFANGYNPASVLYDVPTKFGTDEPQNFDSDFFGPLSIRQSLASSRNIPAVKAFFLVDDEGEVLEQAQKLGAGSPLKNKLQWQEERGSFKYGWPLALGTAETPLYEMVQAYNTFAKAGTYTQPNAILRITKPDGSILYEAQSPSTSKAIDERIAYQITDILSDTGARPDEFWRKQLSVGGHQTAAKTGTSNKCLEYEDGACIDRKPDNAWLLGYTPTLVTGVWVGNADSTPLTERAGGLNSASPIWKQYMVAAHDYLETPVTAFAQPSGLITPQVSRLSGQLPAPCTPLEDRYSELFLAEAGPNQQDPSCEALLIDKVTGLLASDACPAEAAEEQFFFRPRSIEPANWPTWEAAVQTWAANQILLLEEGRTLTGTQLPLPFAPTEQCDPSLTPGRLSPLEVAITSPRNGQGASYPSFKPTLNITGESPIESVAYYIDDTIVETVTSPPYNVPLRAPRNINKAATHTLRVVVTDAYFNKVESSVNFKYQDDTSAPTVNITAPTNTQIQQGAAVTMMAEAEDSDGGIKFLEFYLDDVLLTTRSTAPYSFTYDFNVTPGQYTIAVIARDTAQNQTRDELNVTVVGRQQLEPAIDLPRANATFNQGQVVGLEISTPDLTSINASNLIFAVTAPGGSEIIMMSYRQADGTYQGDWTIPNTAGDYQFELRSVINGTVKVWGRRTVTVQ